LSGSPVSRKLATDIGWNIISFAVIGICGILGNALIAKLWDSEALGIFNQVNALNIIASQIGIMGIQLSVLKAIPQHIEDPEKVSVIFSSALILVSITALVLCLIAFFSRFLWIGIFESKGVEIGFLISLPSLFFYSLNRIILATHNACRRMRLFAFFMGLRFPMMLTVLLALNHYGADGSKVSGIFTVTEVLLFSMLLPVTLKHTRFVYSHDVKEWIKTHFIFGGKGFVGNLLLDMNTRVDILVLGVFLTDRIVGIYSFAAFIADGFRELIVVFRTNINPIITQFRYSKNKKEFETALKNGKRLFYKLFIPTGIIVTLLFPLLIDVCGLSSEMARGFIVLIIIMLGVMISSGYIPLQMILTQTGSPGYQTTFQLYIFLTNLFLNIILIPLFGMVGAAVATAIATVSQIVHLKRMTYKTLGIKI
jgi:O-antigen/teichoic acid export membrane protein